jgi:hypothetical protein
MSEDCNMIMGEVWIDGSQVIVRGIPIIDLIEAKEPEAAACQDFNSE